MPELSPGVAAALLLVLAKARTWTQTGVEQAGLFGASSSSGALAKIFQGQPAETEGAPMRPDSRAFVRAILTLSHATHGGASASRDTLAKVTGHQGALIPPRPGLALVASGTNPRARRWQRMTPEDAHRLGHPTLRGIMADAEKHLARLPEGAHIGGGAYAAALRGPLNTLKVYASHAEAAHADPALPNGELSSKQRAGSERALEAAIKLHDLNERAAKFRPAPSATHVKDNMGELQAAETLVTARRLQTADPKDPWAKAGRAALGVVRARLDQHPDQQAPAVRLARSTGQVLDALATLPAEFYMPQHGGTVGRIADHLRDTEAHAHRLAWNAEQGVRFASRSEAKLAEVQRLLGDVRTARRAPARLDLHGLPTPELFTLLNDADGLRNPAGGDEWTNAQQMARAELRMREGPDAVAIETRRRELEGAAYPDMDLAARQTREGRGMLRADPILEQATRREMLRREMLAQGRHEAAARLFGTSNANGAA